MKRIICYCILLLTPISIAAQDTDSSLFVQFDLASRWVWRGVSYSETPVLQSSLGYQDSRFTGLVWVSYPLGRREYAEFDFIAEYNFTKWFKLGFTDYFGFTDTLNTSQEFFNTNPRTTRHVADLYFVIKPVPSIPLSLMWSTWFWGGDRDRVTRESLYSSYCELRLEKKAGLVTVYPFVGATPWKGFYAGKAAFVNAGIGFSRTYYWKNGLNMPMKLEFVLNPAKENVFMNAVISLR